MKASTRRFSSSCPSAVSLLSLPADDPPLPGDAEAAAARSLKVSDFRITTAAASCRSPRVSHVSDFLRWRASGTARPSVIVRQVLSNVSFRLGLLATPSAFPKDIILIEKI